MHCPTGWRSQTAKAVHDYTAQSWTERELVITTPEQHAGQVEENVNELIPFSIRSSTQVLSIEGTEAVCRNATIQASTGDLLTWFEESSRHHPARLQVQADRMIADESEACGIAGYMYYKRPTRELFAINMSVRQYNWQRLYPFSLMFKREGAGWTEEGAVRFVRDRAEKKLSTEINGWHLYLCEGDDPPNRNHGPLSRQGLGLNLDMLLSSLAIFSHFDGPVTLAGNDHPLTDYPVGWDRL